MKKLFKSLVVAGAISAGAMGCGAGTQVDPLSLMTDSSIPALDTIIPTTTAYSQLSQGFSSANPFWIFNTGGIYGSNALAPASGYITEVGTATVNGSAVNFVTIVHSGRLSTRIYGVTLTTARPGDAVVRSQVIGTFIAFTTANVGFQVLLDGQPVCPLSFMSSNFRTLLQTSVFQQLAGAVCAP